jgi:hypothetical protein
MDIASLPKMNRVTCAWIPEEEPEPAPPRRPPIWAYVALGLVWCGFEYLTLWGIAALLSLFHR